MSEELGQKLQDMFKTIYESTDLKYLRPIKRQMFKCGYDCLDETRSIRDAEKCIDDCGKPLHKAMTTVQTEVTAFQGRIDRCLMDCQDGVRNEKDESKARLSFERCAERCLEKFTPNVASVSKNICDSLAKLKKEIHVD